MTSNPFLSDTFSTLWSKRFHNNKKEYSFKFLNGPSFFKLSFLPIYVNLGRNLTKGISYDTIDIKNKEHKKRVFLIYDIPQYFELIPSTHPKNLGLFKVKQYPGFLINLEEFTDFSHYMTTTFNKSSRYKLNKYKKRLEASFDISYKMFYGEISNVEYDFIFDHFKKLLQKRFNDKQTINNNLNPREWDFYKEVSFPMILEKQASLYVIYSGNAPIGITLNYHSDKVLFDAITVFDIDYSKFHVGSVTIMKLIEWCMENNLKALDFSKGYFDYKTRWANKTYNFEYHIWYDKTSFSSISLAYFIKAYFVLKQKLRERNLNEKFQKLLFRIRHRNKENQQDQLIEFKFTEPTTTQDPSKLKVVPINERQNDFLKPIVFDFLYLNSEKLDDVSLYKIDDDSNSYLISGKNLRQEIQIG